MKVRKSFGGDMKESHFFSLKHFYSEFHDSFKTIHMIKDCAI